MREQKRLDKRAALEAPFRAQIAEWEAKYANLQREKTAMEEAHNQEKAELQQRWEKEKAELYDEWCLEQKLQRREKDLDGWLGALLGRTAGSANAAAVGAVAQFLVDDGSVTAVTLAELGRCTLEFDNFLKLCRRRVAVASFQIQRRAEFQCKRPPGA